MSESLLHFRGIVLGPSGYAGEGREWLRAFADAGLAPSLEGAAFGPEQCALDPVDVALLRTAAARPRGLVVPTFHHVPAHAFEPDPRAPWNVLRTMFETEGIPASWREPLARADLILVPSTPGRAAFLRGGLAPERVHVAPPPLAVGSWRPPLLPRTRRGVFKVLAIGEWTARKAHDVLVAAFARTFRRGEAELWIKTHASSERAASIQDTCDRIARTHARGESPIVRTLCASLGQDQMAQLFEACDALAQPSRGEGWGRPVHEAMLRGIPVVATRAGSLADLMPDASCGWPVRSRVVPVDPASAQALPLFRGQEWHEPDLDDLARQLRLVHDEPVEAHRRALLAHRHITALCEPRRIVDQVAKLLGVTSAAAV